MSPVPHIAILGAGASGVLLALHLLRDPSADARVTLIDPADEPGRGLAYRTRCDEHVLNVPASNMSAYADVPDHFWQWLKTGNLDAGDDSFVFVPRHLFGTYLGDLLAEHADDPRLNLIAARAIDLVPTPNGVDITLSSGATVGADLAVIATGHDNRSDVPGALFTAPGSAADSPLDPDATVLILGTGLSMVDVWLSLRSAGHRGAITALSRHGLLPRAHTQPSRLKLHDVPIGANPRTLLRWVRRSIAQHDGNWREIVDGLRPHSQAIWRSWSPASRRQFLRHLRPRWNVHRHRLPAELHRRVVAAVAAGDLTIEAGRLANFAHDCGQILVELDTPNGPGTRRIDRVYDCTGLAVDLERSSNPLLRALLARGLARPDPVHIGLDVTVRCELTGREGEASDRILVIGPLTRGAFFEIEAVPDIRAQAAQLAARINASINASREAPTVRPRFATAPFFATR